MIRAIKAAPSGYSPPSANKLSGPLLDEVFSNMEHLFHQRDPDRVLAAKFGCTYASDGWDSVDHLPLVNSAFISANDGGRFWRSVDTSGHTKSAEYLASLMII